MTDALSLPPSLRERLEVLGTLGQGSFGAVYEVRAPGHERPLALKLLSPEVDSARVARELQACARVRHPHVLEVVGCGVADGVGWILMERAEGTLTGLLDDPRRVREAWEACRQVAAGLAALHRHGIVHRDLKPENVLMVDGVAKVGDLGLAKGGGLRTLTATGLVMGTPSFMAPEQIRGERLTPACDVFALGIMLYRVSTGRMPYSSTEVRHLLPVITRGGPVVAGVPLGGCPEVVRACLDPDPTRRPGAGALARELGPPPTRERPPPAPDAATRVLTSPGLLAGAPTPVTPVKGVAARSVAMVGGRNLALVVGVAALVVVALGWFRGGAPGTPASAPSPRPGPEASAAPDEAAWPEALGEDFVAEVRAALGDAQLSYVNADGAVAVADVGGVPEGAEPLLTADPANWRRVVGALDPLGRWYGWVAAGHSGDELTAAQRQELARLDEAFRNERQPAPFQPWRDLQAHTGAPVSIELPAFDGAPAVTGSFTGWTATALRRLARARDARARLADEFQAYFRGEESSFPGAALEGHGLRYPHQLHMGTGEDLWKTMPVLWKQPTWRKTLAPWLEPLSVEATAAAVAARRAIEREPAHAGVVVWAYNAAADAIRSGRYGGRWGLDFAVVAGPPPEGAIARVLRAVLWDQHTRSHDHLYRQRVPGHLQRRWELWSAPFEAEDAAVLREQPWYHWLVRFRFVHGVGARVPEAELRALARSFAGVIAAMDPVNREQVEFSLAEAALREGLEPGRARELLAHLRELRTGTELPDQFEDVLLELEEIADG